MSGHWYPHQHHICGCYFLLEDGRHYFPQVRLQSLTTIGLVCFTTALTQTYHNPHPQPLKRVRYTFPLFDGVAVSGYTIEYGDVILQGVVKHKDAAKQTYNAAIARGETAGLLESLPAGVFGVTLGNVPAKTDIVVRITYCGELKHDAAVDGLRYTLPTSIAPRYGSYPGTVGDTNALPTGGISITVDVDMGGSAIRRVQSPTHPISVSMGELSTAAKQGEPSPFVPSRASASLALGSAELAGDFVLQLCIDDLSKPQAILETHPTIPGQRALMMTLVPKFALPSSYPEVVFLADQSGSMGGKKNTALMAALNIFLKSLPLGVRFNICAFGSKCRFLWPTSQAYNETNLTEAVAFVGEFRAEYGGTEILKPLRMAFEHRLKDMALEVMLLTDGEVWAQEDIFSFLNQQVQDKDSRARVFALGIGEDVSHTLVEGVARAGNGFAQFVTQSEDTDQKVMRMLKGALHTHTKDHELEVHYLENDASGEDDDFELVDKVRDCLHIQGPIAQGETAEKASIPPPPKSFFDTNVDLTTSTKLLGADRAARLPKIASPKLLQAPTVIPPLFPFNRATVYLLLGPGAAQGCIKSVTLRAASADGPLELTVPVQEAPFDHTGIHQLAAKRAIQELEEGRGWLRAATTSDGDTSLISEKYKYCLDELVERAAVELGERFQVAGRWTSFVAVNDGVEKQSAGNMDDALDVPDAVPVRSSGTYGGHRKMLASTVPMMAMQRSAPINSHNGNNGLGQDTMDESECSTGSNPWVASMDSASPARRNIRLSNRISRREAPGDMPSGDTVLGNATPSGPTFGPTASGGAGYGGGGLFGGGSFGGGGALLTMSQAVSSISSKADIDSPQAVNRLGKAKGPGLHQLIGLQTFQGSWPWNKELQEILNVSSAIEMSLYGEDREAAGTALTIAYLETKMQDKRDVWEMVVGKARVWLQKQLGLDQTELDDLVKRSDQYLGEN